MPAGSVGCYIDGIFTVESALRAITSGRTSSVYASYSPKTGATAQVLPSNLGAFESYIFQDQGGTQPLKCGAVMGNYETENPAFYFSW